MMTREQFIISLADGYLINGHTLRWDRATDEERAEAQVIIDRLSSSIQPPPEEPEAEYDPYAVVGASIPRAFAATV